MSMDSNRYARSRTSSTGSLPSTPAHTPNTSTLTRAGHGVFQSFQQFQAFSVSPDLLAANLTRVRAEQGSRGSSIPPTPAPTPNLSVHNHMIPEQLAAGIKNLRADEGYIESSSVPATPAPSPFCPSPGQSVGFSADQVAESIRRLREDDSVSGYSDVSTGQPPTPSSTPGPAGINQEIVPERLAESIQHLRCDEGLESTSNPATPIPTPISPLFAQQGLRAHQVLPEQLAAGIHRLKVEEGMSSGGSSGFPSTPAPTPFTFHPGGVRPEDLAAGISRLSVIEEGESLATHQHQQQLLLHPQQKVSIRVVMDESGASDSQPNLSQYFSDATGGNVSTATFFDQLSPSNSTTGALNTTDTGNSTDTGNATADDEDQASTAVLHSCRESHVDLPEIDGADSAQAKEADEATEAKLDVLEQVYDDVRSLQRRQSQDGATRRHHHSSTTSDVESPNVCNIFSTPQPSQIMVTAAEDPFDTILSGQNVELTTTPEAVRPSATPETSRPPPPNTLATRGAVDIVVAGATPSSVAGSIYATPVAPTPSGDASFAMTSTPMAPTMTPYHANMPITSPLPIGSSPGVVPLPPMIVNPHDSVSGDDTEEDSFPPEILRRRDAWIASPNTLRIIESIRAGGHADRSLLTTPGIHFRDVLQDPVRNLIAHYRGEAEAAKRQVLTSDSVSQDERGLRQLIDAGCYRAAINLTTLLLQQCQQGQPGAAVKHTPYSLRLWSTRLSLLVKLKQFSNAEVESEAFGDLDRPDLYYDFYPDSFPHRHGSMVPFSFRILLAEMPHNLGKHHEALDRLYALLSIVDQILSNLQSGKLEDGRKGTITPDDQRDSIQLWNNRRLRIIYALANCAISQKDFDLAASILETLLASERPEKCHEVKSSLGRVFLQLGDLVTASEMFEEAKILRSQISNESTQNEMEVANLLDACFLAIASNNYVEALAHLEAANIKSPGNPIIITNMSVCLLYLGRLKDAIANLETNLTANPALFLQETTVLNLATLYELESSFAGQKKLALLDLMGQFAGDGVNTTCLKF